MNSKKIFKILLFILVIPAGFINVFAQDKDLYSTEERYICVYDGNSKITY